MEERLRIATIEAGGTWGRLIQWILPALESAGFKPELLRRGSEVPETLERVASGEADLSVTTTFAARAACEGKLPYSGRMPIRGVAEIQYPLHWFVAMIRADLGLSSFAELAARKPRLRLCLPAPNLLVSYPVKSIFRLFGLDPYKDIPAWGGEIIREFSTVPELIARGEADGVIRENSPLRYDASRAREMKFFQLTRAQAEKVADEMAMQVSVIPAGTYTHQAEDLTTVDAEGFTFYVPAAFPGHLAYRIARALDLEMETHYLSASIFYSTRFAVRTGADLHEGAARYYREKGYL